VRGGERQIVERASGALSEKFALFGTDDRDADFFSCRSVLE